MQLEVRSLLVDMQHAAAGIELFVAGKTFETFESDLMLRRAVERQFEIIGEALTRIRKIDKSVLDRISESPRIIGFRNALIHGYDTIRDDITWKIAIEKLPLLQREIDELVRGP